MDSEAALTANVAGCIDLHGARDCAVAVQTSTDCAHTACIRNCPISDEATLLQYRQCLAMARAGECRAHADAADACVAALRSKPAAICVSGTTLKEQYDVLAPMFCGPAPADASAD